MKRFYIIIGLLCLVLIYFIGYAITNLPVKLTIVLLCGFIFSILTLINAEIGLYLLIFVIPFTQQLRLGRFGGGALPIDVGTDDLLIIFILVSWLVGLARRKEPIILKTSLNWPLAAYFAAVVFSFFKAYTRFGGGTLVVSFLHLLKYYEYVAVYFIIVSVVNNINQIKKFLTLSFIIAGFIATIHFIALFHTGEFSMSNPPREGLYLVTMHAFISNVILGSYYCLFLLILLGIILYTPTFKKKLPSILLAFLLSAALFNAYSRSAYVGLIAGFLVLAFMKEKKLFLVVLLLVIFSPIYMQSAILERITFTVQSFKPLTLDSSSQVRLELWRRTAEIFIKNPLFGVGYWTVIRVLYTTAHSQYLSVLAETGIIGFSAFCWIFVRLFKHGITLAKKADDNFLKALGLGYTAALGGISAIFIFGEIMGSFRFIGPFWFVTGLVVSANRLLAKKGERLDIDST